jgi:ribosome-associated translation inhibitor RaiA
MAVPLQISYREIDRSEGLDRLVAHEAAKLEGYFEGILSCRVVIEHDHHRQRSGAPYQARVTLSLPGEDVFINQTVDVHERPPADDESDVHQTVQKRANVDAAFKDPVLAIRSAFKKARRVLEDRARRMREASSSRTSA